MVFTSDYSTSKLNDLLPVSHSARYNSVNTLDIDFNHMHSSSTIGGDRKYDVVNTVSYSNDKNTPIIHKLYPDCSKTRSKSVTLFLGNTGILTEFENKNSSNNTRHDLLCDTETEIQDTHYLILTPSVSSTNKRAIPPHSFTENLSDVPNRSIPMDQNVKERLIKKSLSVKPI